MEDSSEVPLRESKRLNTPETSCCRSLGFFVLETASGGVHHCCYKEYQGIGAAEKEEEVV